VIKELGAASDRIGGLIEANYELTIAAAEAWLLKFNPIVMKWFVEHRHRIGQEHRPAIAIPTVEPGAPPVAHDGSETRE
jgi:hypothetical protein